MASAAVASGRLRAGESGYSLSRRPITTLDPNILPTFVTTPRARVRMLDESSREDVNDRQWSDETKKQPQQRRGGGGGGAVDVDNADNYFKNNENDIDNVDNNNNTNDDDDDDDGGLLSLDLHQRTLNLMHLVRRRCKIDQRCMYYTAMARVYLRRRYVRGFKTIGNGQSLFGRQIRQMEEMH